MEQLLKYKKDENHCVEKNEVLTFSWEYNMYMFLITG